MSRFSPGFLAAGQGNDQYTKILLHLDGDLTDSNLGGSAHTWTAHSSSFVTSGQKFGSGALQCPYIDTPAHADFNLGSGDFTVDFWFDSLGLAAGTHAMAGQVSATVAAATSSFYCGLQSADKLFFSVSNGTTITSAIGSTVLTAGLHHFEACRTGNILRLFLDGVQDIADVAFTGTVPSVAANFGVGRPGAPTIIDFGGYIDEFRLSVGIARHTANFTPPTVPYGP